MSARNFAFWFALCACSHAAIAQGSPAKYSQKVLMKNWAVSRCLAQVYSDKTTKDDANSTAGAYLEVGHQPIKVYEALDDLVMKYSKLKYGSVTGSNLNTMKCIDFFNSKELDQIAGKISRK